MKFSKSFLIKFLIVGVSIIGLRYLAFNNGAVIKYNIKDYNLNEYFRDPVLGRRKNITYHTPASPFSTTIKYYEWEIKFKDYYGNQQVYKINTSSDFDQQISGISKDLLAKEVKTIISKNYPVFESLQNRGVKIMLYSNRTDSTGDYYCVFLIDDAFVSGNNFYPKDVNFKTFSQYNPKSSLEIYVDKNTTKSKINDIANLLFSQSLEPVNLMFNNKTDVYSSGMTDIFYLKNKPFTPKYNYDFCYSIIRNED